METVPAPETNDIIPDAQNEPILKAPEPFYQNRIIIIIAIIFLLVVIAGAGYLFYTTQIKPSQSITQIPPISKPAPSKNLVNQIAEKAPDFVVLKVGEENIYKKDLDTEIFYLPGLKNNVTDATINDLFNKMAEDSILLQDNKKKITLTPEIYNSPNKDYLKRVKITSDLKQAKEKEIKDAAGGKIVYTVAVWYYNIRMPSMGLEKAKEIALSKITPLHAQVKSGKMTAKQAMESIYNDSSLAEIDQMYKGNSGHEYKMTSADYPLTADSKFNAEVWNLPKGGVTEINNRVLGEKEQYYVFAQVIDMINNTGFQTYNEWLNGQKKIYEITKY